MGRYEERGKKSPADLTASLPQDMADVRKTDALNFGDDEEDASGSSLGPTRYNLDEVMAEEEFEADYGENYGSPRGEARFGEPLHSDAQPDIEKSDIARKPKERFPAGLHSAGRGGKRARNTGDFSYRTGGSIADGQKGNDT